MWVAGRPAGGWLVGNCDFNENLSRPLGLGLRLRVCQFHSSTYKLVPYWAAGTEYLVSDQMGWNRHDFYNLATVPRML